MKENELKLCFSCAKVYQGENAEILICPECGNEISIDKYESIMRDVRDAVYFGWNYRLQYEKDLEENGKINTHYYLEQCEEIINFIALAVVSGIVGGFAYDVVKKAVRSVADFVRKKGNLKEESKIFSLIENEEDMKKFVQYIEEYYTSFENINEEMRNAVFEEMLVDKISPTLENIILANNSDIDINRMKEIDVYKRQAFKRKERADERFSEESGKSGLCDEGI